MLGLSELGRTDTRVCASKMGGGGSKDNSGTVVAAGGGGRGPGRSSASSAAYDNLSPLDQAELKEVFNLFDTDKNGTIEEHEIHTAMEELGFSNVTSEEIQDMMRFADKDNNGRLDLYEFAEMMNSRMGSREAGVEQLKVFEIMCQKDDASLSKEREGETPVPRRDGGAADLVALHDKVTREDLIRIATQLGENQGERDRGFRGLN